MKDKSVYKHLLSTQQEEDMFFRVKRLKQNRKIDGIETIQSIELTKIPTNPSPQINHDDMILNSIKAKIEAFKNKKAYEIASISKILKSNLSQQMQVHQYEIEKQLQEIINSEIQVLSHNFYSSPKDLPSTAIRSKQSTNTFLTPSSDQPKYISEFSVEQNQFTFGTKNEIIKINKAKEQMNEKENEVSINENRFSTKSIKNRIMKANKLMRTTSTNQFNALKF